MIDFNSPDQLTRGIQQLEENLEYLKHSNFCQKEKRQLREIYGRQLETYRQKRLSFYADKLTPNFT